jgi:predicted MFS family arabinose efflux permease
MKLPAYVGRHWPATALIMTFTIADGGATTLLPPMFRDEGKDPVAIGVLVAVPAVIALIMRLPGGMLYSAARARPLMAGSLALVVASMALYPLTTDNLLLALIGAVYGAGYSAFTTVNMASVIESIGPGEDRAGAIGFYVSGFSTGYAISSSLWGFVAEGSGFRAGFWGMAAVAGAALLTSLFGKRPEPVPAPERQREALSPWRRAQTFGGVLLDQTVMFMMLGAFFINAFLAQFSTFMPLTLLGLGVTLGQIGALRSIWSFTNTVGRVFGGPVLKRMDHRRAQDASLILQAGMLALFAFPMPFAAYAVVTVAAASGRAICYVANAVAMSEVDTSRVSRGVASGIMNAAGDLGKIAGPASGGFIARAVGLERFWLVAPPLYLAIYFGVLLALRWRRQPQRLPAAV